MSGARAPARTGAVARPLRSLGAKQVAQLGEVVALAFTGRVGAVSRATRGEGRAGGSEDRLGPDRMGGPLPVDPTALGRSPSEPDRGELRETLHHIAAVVDAAQGAQRRRRPIREGDTEAHCRHRAVVLDALDIALRDAQQLVPQGIGLAQSLRLGLEDHEVAAHHDLDPDPRRLLGDRRGGHASGSDAPGGSAQTSPTGLATRSRARAKCFTPPTGEPGSPEVDGPAGDSTARSMLRLQRAQDQAAPRPPRRPASRRE